MGYLADAALRTMSQLGVAIKCDPFGSELHGFGSSISCLGRRVTSYTTRDQKEIAKLLALLP